MSELYEQAGGTLLVGFMAELLSKWVSSNQIGGGVSLGKVCYQRGQCVQISIRIPYLMGSACT